MMIANFLIFIALVWPINCFLDTGSVYFNHELPKQYIIDSKLLINEIRDKCSGLANKKLNIYRIEQFDNIPNGNFIKHVQYDLIDNLDDFTNLCGLESVITDIKSVDEIVYNDELILIQQVPKFTKRDNQIYDEYAEDLKAIESAAASEGDSDVYIMEDVETAKSTKSTGSLFTKYQFFSSGIFMCLIVAFFLIFVLTNALSWISSIEITYQSFEKQVDLEKKNE